jgi:hypothetical protein
MGTRYERDGSHPVIHRLSRTTVASLSTPAIRVSEQPLSDAMPPLRACILVHNGGQYAEFLRANQAE